MAANPIDLCTLADVKSYLNIQNTTNDALLQLLITAASQYMMTYCGRTFQLTTYTNEAYNGTGNAMQMLLNSPVVAVSAVSVNGIARTPFNQSSYPGGYRFDEDGIYAGCDFGVWCDGFQNVVVSYQAGYATIPYDLNFACIELVAKRYRDKDKSIVTQRSIAGETIIYNPAFDLPPSVKSVLDNYFRVSPL